MFEYVLQVPPDALSCGDTALAVLDECRQVANAAAARLAHTARDLWEVRLCAAEAAGGDAETVSRSAIAEVAVTLGCSQATAKSMIDTAQLLEFRAPIVNEVFRAGDIDFAKARTIAAVLTDASDETIRAIETEVLAAAAHLTPGPLRSAIWRAWMRANPDEAAAVRAGKRASERKVYVRRGTDGLSWLSACLTDLEGSEADRLIDELADSVCAGDPRTRDNRRADALLALLHGEAYLSCRCGAPDCPHAGSEPPQRRAHLLQILVGIETLLGLSEDPGTLPDGTPLDPELIRILAEDATWQGLLVEMRSLAAGPTPDAAADEYGVPDAAAPAVTVSRVAGRGRRRAPGPVPRSAGVARRLRPDGVGLLHDRSYAAFIDGGCPVNDGHGGHEVPPPGALTYRPSAATADIVRATYTTCTFPGCSVASARCELDHQVPFDHADPLRGGWTVSGNLAPLCKQHHDMKTQKLWACTGLGGGAVYWRSNAGIARITVTQGSLAGIPKGPAPVRIDEARESFTDRPTPDEEIDLLYEPTWWELNMGDSLPPPPHDTELRERHREHRDVVRRRYLLQPPPF
ncbi:HNH endonuclease [Aldersonia sp. NBC_00410]|uniref:HNH endonuclease signature motif containing protein n=1 Tax=Aldersonia sp. NBC_00410 TaxID=2975954 RepID=UPI00225004D6|nr:HNH endonuclease signature motif containing protein [Aldersonia sp. NBC_00410]MCX5045366.1 HNH endonuclease [Aldersonia sp. NBC_00410]